MFARHSKENIIEHQTKREKAMKYFDTDRQNSGDREYNANGLKDDRLQPHFSFDVRSTSIHEKPANSKREVFKPRLRKIGKLHNQIKSNNGKISCQSSPNY